MTSFINLMASDVWSEADIINRTEALINSEFSPAAVAILNRKATGAALGKYQLSPTDVADIARYTEVSERARDLGRQAFKDAELLKEVLLVESALAILSKPTPETEVENLVLIEQDLEERKKAQALVDSASQEVIDLVKLRNPDQEAILKEKSIV